MSSIFESDGKIGRVQFLVHVLKAATLTLAGVYVASLGMTIGILVLPDLLRVLITLLLLISISGLYWVLVVCAVKKRLRDIGHEGNHWMFVLGLFVPGLGLLVVIYLYFWPGKSMPEVMFKINNSD